jgi:hypothetical protein
MHGRRIILCFDPGGVEAFMLHLRGLRLSHFRKGLDAVI